MSCEQIVGHHTSSHAKDGLIWITNEQDTSFALVPGLLLSAKSPQNSNKWAVTLSVPCQMPCIDTSFVGTNHAQ